jgi:hypothetical protein
MTLLSSFIGGLSDSVKGHTDHAAFAGIIAAIFGWLPGLAALVSIAWYGVRFWDWLERRKLRQILVKEGKIEEALQVKANQDA